MSIDQKEKKKKEKERKKKSDIFQEKLRFVALDPGRRKKYIFFLYMWVKISSF